jgi:tetratricopeptide (TPR) repeat protein
MTGAGVAMAELTLKAREVESASRWRWVLTGPGGVVVAEHRVQLDEGCWQYEAFGDPHAYLRWRVVPDRRVEHESEVVAQLGEWVGAEVLGPVGAALVAQRPVTVRVVVPTAPVEPRPLMFLPLELAHVGGGPVALQDVTFVHCGVDDAAGTATGSRGRLRVLGLFSVPDGERPLNLRGERQTLLRLFRELAGKDGRAVDVQVLQYGVTRDRLRDVLAQAEGWDLVHISGHGTPGELLLETEDGSPDRITASELAGLLEVARGRLKLVSVSACWSAGPPTSEQRRLLGLPRAAKPPARVDRDEGGRGRNGGVAAELVDRLGCAVLAMRYPVTDLFAAELAQRLYRLLVGDGQPLPRALAAAVRATVTTPASRACPALSVATPALFGAGAVGLRLPAPPTSGAAAEDAMASKLAGFPPQPDRFVGRVAVMARSSAALAPRSGASGVLFHGIPGGGKSACAVELAHTHEHAFDRLVWFKAPDDGMDIADSLARFALALEFKLPGLRLVHVVDDIDRFAAALPQLTQLCAGRRLLVVIDNAESLLTGTGAWRDPRWAALIAALSGHAGLGRLVLSSRRIPDDLDPRVWPEAVNALTLDEALLLAEALPRLNDLLHGRLPGVEPAVARKLASGVLDAAAGHPKLLELADGQATDPDRLARLLATGGSDFVHVLLAWTRNIAAGLDTSARALFQSLCCMEEQDRTESMVNRTWADLRARLGVAEDRSTAETNVAALAACGLVTVRPRTGSTAEYGIHPAVAQAGRDDAGRSVQKVVDDAAQRYWLLDVFAEAHAREATASAGALVARAGLGVAPYLLRLGHLQAAVGFIGEALHRDNSPATRSLALPLLRRIVAATAGTREGAGALVALAQILRRINPAAAEQHMRRAFDLAIANHDHDTAAVAINELIRYHRQAGQLNEALALTERLFELDRQEEVGPLTQLLHKGNYLQLLLDLGRAEEVLAEATGLLESIRDLTEPEYGEGEPGVTTWTVRELLLDAGAQAAFQLKRYQLALDLNNAAIASHRARGAAPADLGQALFNNSIVLRHLGHLDDAVALLRECRKIFEQARDIDLLGTVLNALATVESQRGHGDVAISLQRDALRYQYVTGHVDGIAVTHHCLGTDLGRYAGDLNGSTAHYLAAALLSRFAGSVAEETSVADLASNLRKAGDTALVPADITQLCQRVDAVPGVDLGRLLARCASPDELQRALENLTARARAAAARSESFAAILAMWEPLIAAIVAARHGDTDAATYVDTYLSAADSSAQDGRRIAAILAALRLIHHGNHDPDTSDLDEVAKAIIARALDAVTGRSEILIDLWPAVSTERSEVLVDLWPAVSFGSLMGHIVKAVAGSSGASAATAREKLDDLLTNPGDAPLARALEQILGGDRDPGLASKLDDPADRAIVATVLHYIDRWA